jgi:hypothetical protein
VADSLAARIWDTARPIKKTLAERYLANVCGIDIEQITDIDDVLRFNGNELLALMRDVVTDAPKAIIRIALDDAGQKIEQRALGSTKGAAVKLWEDAAVTLGLVVGEELEATAAAATRVEYQGTLLTPAWTLIERGNLLNFPVLTAIEALTILVSGGGQETADVCTRRWLAAGREVHQLITRSVGTATAGGVR